MAVYCPPSYTETLTVFNNKYYVDNCPAITTAYLNANFLRYPTGQGSENFLNTLSGENCVISPTGLSNINGYDISIIPSANINLEANNINSYGSALPICFDAIETDRNYNYGSGGQVWELVWTQNLNVPSKFFCDSPPSGYTSNKWRVEFSLNTWGGGNNSDKALAFYIDFQDQNGNFYSLPVFNKDRPFVYHNNNSTWNQGGGFEFGIPISWTDIIDFTALGGTGSGNLPLKFNVYVSADNSRNFDFNYKIGLTRTNLL